MTVTKASNKRIRISVAFSVFSEQSCITETKPTTVLNFGSSQDIRRLQDIEKSREKKWRKTKSCSPPRKTGSTNDQQETPHIVVSGVEEVEASWNQLAAEIEESSYKAKIREKKKKSKRAKANSMKKVHLTSFYSIFRNVGV